MLQKYLSWTITHHPFREASIQCPYYAITNTEFTATVGYAIKTALIADLEATSQGNEPTNLQRLESPILGMEIHIKTEFPDTSSLTAEDDWIPTRRSRITCALSGKITLEFMIT